MEITQRLVRRTHFCSAHRYFNPLLSEDENKTLFGDLYSPHGFGHNFILDAYVEGELDVNSGMIIPIRKLDSMMKEVTQLLDHKHLNYDLPYFHHIVPSVENIAVFCFNLLQLQLQKYDQKLKLHKVRLYEGDDLWVDYSPHLQPEN